MLLHHRLLGLKPVRYIIMRAELSDHALSQSRCYAVVVGLGWLEGDLSQLIALMITI